MEKPKIKYPIEIHHLPEDEGGGILAFLPDFGHSACSAVGDTIEEALAELEKVKESVISIMEEEGRPIPQPTGDPAIAGSLQQVPIRIPKSIHRKVKDISHKEGMSINSLLYTIIVEFITTYGVKGLFLEAPHLFRPPIGKNVDLG